MPRKIIKIMSMIILILLGAVVIILGIQESDFSNIKKYDDKTNSARDIMSLSKQKRSNMQRHDRSVKIESDTIANLGDFNFNIADNKTLVANISLKYKSDSENSGWFNNKDSVDVEIIKKSVLLRDAVINTMIGNDRATVNSERIRKELKKSINKNLTCGEVEEVYFNKFLIQ